MSSFPSFLTTFFIYSIAYKEHSPVINTKAAVANDDVEDVNKAILEPCIPVLLPLKTNYGSPAIQMQSCNGKRGEKMWINTMKLI